MARTFMLGSALMAALLLVGCGTDTSTEDEDANADELVSVNCPDVSKTDVTRSLAVTDPTVVAKFSFPRLMSQIRATANVAESDSVLSEFQRWMATFDNCGDLAVDPNGYKLKCGRSAESTIRFKDPFAAEPTFEFVPVAVFNRFDLAPQTGANCGEYRVVYKATSPTFRARAFLIFEASLPNPTPNKGIDACLPVARFWQSLSTDNDAASRASKLENFFFSGNAVKNFGPVVQAQNYGLSTNGGTRGRGQIRTNFFMDRLEWNLREFKLSRTCSDANAPATCRLDFTHVAASANPANELFAGTHERSAAFRTAFADQVPKLAAPGVNGIQMTTSSNFNEFESVAIENQIGSAGALTPRGRDVLYSNLANEAMRSTIKKKLASMNSSLTVDNVLNRATTQTCAGCHQLSNGKTLGGGQTWPSSLGFVQVNERGELSEALTGTFLPKRKATLEKFINARCNGRQATSSQHVAADETVGGSIVGAAN